MVAKQANFVKTAVRMPPDLHKAVHEAARKEDRTYNGQILAMLRLALNQTQGAAQ